MVINLINKWKAMITLKVFDTFDKQICLSIADFYRIKFCRYFYMGHLQYIHVQAVNK